VLSEGDIDRIAQRIARHHAPLAVGVFGSYAIGTAGAGSDLDLFVIKDTVDPPFARARAIRRLLFGVLHPLDIHVFTPEEFEAEVEEHLSFAWVIVRQAKLFFAADEARRRVPSLFARDHR
jgi:uncharacterized protein